MGFYYGAMKVIKYSNFEKKAMQIINKTHLLAHTDPIFKKEKILKVADIFKIKSYKLFFKFVEKELPAKLMNFFASKVHQTICVSLTFLIFQI